MTATRLNLLLLLAFAYSCSSIKNILNFKEWTIDYLHEKIAYMNELSLSMSFSNGVGQGGSRLHSDIGYHVGSYCADVSTEQTDGTVFALFLTSSESVNGIEEKWDELGFEFTFAKTKKYLVRVNAIHNGVSASELGSYAANNDNSRYCISWKTGPGGKADWYINGNLVQSMSLTRWKKPLKPSVSFWGSAPQNDCTVNASSVGCNHLSGKIITAAITNGHLSTIQEDFAPDTLAVDSIDKPTENSYILKPPTSFKTKSNLTELKSNVPTFFPEFLSRTQSPTTNIHICSNGQACHGCQFCSNGELCPDACMLGADYCSFCPSEGSSSEIKLLQTPQPSTSTLRPSQILSSTTVQISPSTNTPSTSPIQNSYDINHCSNNQACQGCQYCGNGELCPNACIIGAPYCPFCPPTPTVTPTSNPSVSLIPTAAPTTKNPFISPSVDPSTSPSAAPSLVGSNILNFNDWTIDYSPQNVFIRSPVDVSLSYGNAPNKNGARMTTKGLLEGTFCSNLTLNQVGGTVFAIYLSSGEPENRAVDKWDEIDLEFPYPTTVNDQVWVNAYHDGEDVAGFGVNLPSQVNSRYCLTWKVGPGGVAYWIADGQVIHAIALDSWLKPLKPYISYWGSGPGFGAGSFTGLNAINSTYNVISSALDCYLSSAQMVLDKKVVAVPPPSLPVALCKNNFTCSGCQFCATGELCPNACDEPGCPWCPTFNPSSIPTSRTTNKPSAGPSVSTSIFPHGPPTIVSTTISSSPPSDRPSISPATKSSSPPTLWPSCSQSVNPSSAPSAHPQSTPSRVPSSGPSFSPSRAPSFSSSSNPSNSPSVVPSNTPSIYPTSTPSFVPSSGSSKAPSAYPVYIHSLVPSFGPSWAPSIARSSNPSIMPSTLPTNSQVPSPTREDSFSPSISVARSLPLHPTRSPSYIGSVNANESSDSSSYLDSVTGKSIIGGVALSIFLLCCVVYSFSMSRKRCNPSTCKQSHEQEVSTEPTELFYSKDGFESGGDIYGCDINCIRSDAVAIEIDNPVGSTDSCCDSSSGIGSDGVDVQSVSAGGSVSDGDCNNLRGRQKVPLRAGTHAVELPCVQVFRPGYSRGRVLGQSRVRDQESNPTISESLQVEDSEDRFGRRKDRVINLSD